MWISSFLLTATSVVEEFINIHYEIILLTVLSITLCIGWAMYQANIPQFGIDQLIEASVSEYKAFVVWLVFVAMGSQLIMYCMLQCLDATAPSTAGML